MALATSGALTLDQIHVEAGGSTGTTCSLNDTDIRGLNAASGRTINSTQGTEIDFADFYGASVTVATDLTAAGTGGTHTSTIGVGKGASTIVQNGVDTSFNSHGSWSDQDFATTTRGSFKIYSCFSSTTNSINGLTQIVVDSSAGQGITWSAFSGFRYIRLNSTTGNIIFDSNAVTANSGQGQISIFGTHGGASSGTNGTTWFHNVINHMPSSGTFTLHLTN